MEKSLKADPANVIRMGNSPVGMAIENGFLAALYPLVNGFYQNCKVHGLADPTWLMRLGLILVLAAMSSIWIAYRIVRYRSLRLIICSGAIWFWTIGNLSTELHSGHFAPVWVVLTMAAAVGGAAVAVWAIVQVLRAVDELQRRINYQALSFAFVGTLIVTLLGAILEGFGIPRLPWILMTAVMVVLWGAGPLFSARRYQ